MQNRSMFPYRRHGPKKRTKGGPIRKPHGPQKGLPNSARDLLPMLQPATKALAQMLAGRTQISGQLEQARAMLGQAERLIADRVHNRLNPAEREEFFEQIARLRLTIADAEAEAEVRAAERQVPRPTLPPIGQERLKEVAMALATPEGRRRPPAGEDAGAATAPAEFSDRPAAEPEVESRGAAPRPATGDRLAEAAPAEPEPAPTVEGPRRLLAINRPGRLELPKDAALNVPRNLSIIPRAIGRRRASGAGPRAAAMMPAPAEPGQVTPPGSAHDPAGNGAADKAKATRRSRKTSARSARGLDHRRRRFRRARARLSGCRPAIGTISDAPSAPTAKRRSRRGVASLAIGAGWRCAGRSTPGNRGLA